MKVILAYVPVLHQGYVDFFNRHSEADFLYIFGYELIKSFDYLSKEIRALAPLSVISSIKGLIANAQLPDFAAGIACFKTLTLLREKAAYVIMPDEDVCRGLAAKRLPGCRVEFDSVFLRWDRTNIHRQDPVKFDRKIPFEGFAAEVMDLAFAESRRASSWWRQVGGVIMKNGELLLSGHNEHMPSVHSVYADGDPRNAARQGENIELSTDSHAEQRLISEAARRGIALESAELYVTTFPCPPCGMAIAHSGIRKLYFLTGYSMVDSERILRAAGVEIILVERQQ